MIAAEHRSFRAALAIAVASVVLARGAVAAADVVDDRPVVVTVDPWLHLRADAVRAAIGRELRAPVLAPSHPTPDPRGALRIGRAPEARLEVEFCTPDERCLRRTVAMPRTRAATLSAIVALAGELARDRVSELEPARPAPALPVPAPAPAERPPAASSALLAAPAPGSSVSVIVLGAPAEPTPAGTPAPTTAAPARPDVDHVVSATLDRTWRDRFAFSVLGGVVSHAPAVGNQRSLGAAQQLNFDVRLPMFINLGRVLQIGLGAGVALHSDVSWSREGHPAFNLGGFVTTTLRTRWFRAFELDYTFGAGGHLWQGLAPGDAMLFAPALSSQLTLAVPVTHGLDVLLRFDATHRLSGAAPDALGAMQSLGGLIGLRGHLP